MKIRLPCNNLINNLLDYMYIMEQFSDNVHTEQLILKFK